MAVVIPDVGKLRFMDWMLINEDPLTSPVVVNLFKNDYTPVAGTTTGDFVLADFTGYTSKDIERTDWTAPAIIGGKASVTAPSAPMHWDNSGSSQTVYGYWVEDPDSGDVLWAKRFDTPQVVNGGGFIELTLTFTDREDT